MTHPGTDELALLLDDELSEDAKKRITAHLATCPTCRFTLADLAQVSQVVRAALPAQCQAACEGDFWGRLLPSLSAPVTDLWSWLALAPALAFAVALLILGWGMGALRAIGGLQRMGMVADWDQAIAEWIPSGLNNPFLGQTLYKNLGWSGEAVSATASDVWQTANQITRDTTTEILVLLVLCFLGIAVVMVGFCWVACWTWSSSGQRGKGRF